jgi:hypothetical protein
MTVAKDLHMSVIADGIETEEQVRARRECVSRKAGAISSRRRYRLRNSSSSSRIRQARSDFLKLSRKQDT